MYPVKKVDVVDEICGIKISDPYRWLEDSKDPEVREWIKKQNQRVDSQLKDDRFGYFSKELARNFRVVSFSSPVFTNGKYFYVEQKPDEDHGVLYMKAGLEGNPIEVVNPNSKLGNNTTSLDYWSVSKTGKYVAYGLSEGGNEMATLHIKDTDSLQDLPETIVHCSHSSVRWLPDDSAFFYTRNARPGTVPVNEERLHVKVYYHKLGSNPDNDELIFGKDRPKDDMLSLTLSPDGKYLGIQVGLSWTEYDIYIYDLSKREVKPLVKGIPSEFHIIFLKDKVFLETNYKANNYRVLESSYQDMYKSIDSWKEFIPERESLIESIRVTKSKVLVEYLVNATSKLEVFDYSGKAISGPKLPECSSLVGVSTNIEEEEFFYGVESFVFTKHIYRYDPVTAEYSEYRKVESPIKSEDYEVRQEWYISKDGTKVPMFILFKKGIKLDGTNPTILFGYGGFNNNETPVFLRNWVPWLENGGIFTIANIRGGGEFGDSWHKDGMKEKKQNSFDDFIFAAEYLISKRYTDHDHLGILGGSNGGLLVSAVGVQRPELFKAVCSRVPLTDMVRFPKFGIAIRWVHEYGDPSVEKDLKNILKWSPYHNVVDNRKYPAFFFTTAEKDTRVDPLHARKMAASIQASNKENSVLIFTEMDAGHGLGKPITKIVESQGLVLSFFAKELELQLP